MLLNQGNGLFFGPISYSADGTIQGITTSDFNGDGLKDIAITSNNNDVTIYHGGTVGNFATFLPDKASQPTSLATLLGQMQTLQGGKPVSVGPYDSTSFITPGTPTPPDYMAHISLPYAPDSLPLSIVSPGWFLSATPATMNQTADGYSYTGSGNVITGWTLWDNNNNPIALATAQQLFGTPVLNPVGANAPVQRRRSHPHRSAASDRRAERGLVLRRPGRSRARPTTWADAFFAWGLGNRRLFAPEPRAELRRTDRDRHADGDAARHLVQFQHRFQLHAEFPACHG